MSQESLFGEPIFSYTRAQALADGVLVDLTPMAIIREHWRMPLACTSTVWSLIERAAENPGQDFSGICHDISMMAKYRIDQAGKSDRVLFEVIIGGVGHPLKLQIGPGDHGEPVLTLMTSSED